MYKKLSLFFLLPFFCDNPVSAQSELRANPTGQALPRGEIPKGKQTVPERSLRHTHQKDGCTEFYSSPLSGDAYFAPRSEDFYIFARNAHTPPPPSKDAKGGDVEHDQYDLLRIDAQSGQVSRNFTLKKRYPGVIIPHGQQTSGVSIMTFNAYSGGCYRGEASGVSVGFGHRGRFQPAASRALDRSEYILMGSSQGPLLADLKERIVLDVDANTFQRRRAFHFPAEVEPLYFDFHSRRLVGWVSSEEDRSGYLRLLSSSVSSSVAEMRVRPDQRFINHGPRFAQLTIDSNENRAILHETREWTNAAANQNYRVTLPSKAVVSQAAFYPQFELKRLVIMGRSPHERQMWRKIWVYDYQNDRLITEFETARQHYISGVEVSSSGAHAAVIVKAIASNQLVAVRFFDMVRSRWTEANLANPN